MADFRVGSCSDASERLRFGRRASTGLQPAATASAASASLRSAPVCEAAAAAAPVGASRCSQSSLTGATTGRSAAHGCDHKGEAGDGEDQLLELRLRGEIAGCSRRLGTVCSFGQPPAVATHVTRGFTLEIQFFNPSSSGCPSGVCRRGTHHSLAATVSSRPCPFLLTPATEVFRAPSGPLRGVS